MLTNQDKSVKTTLKEIRQFLDQQRRRRRPLSERSFVYNWTEVAKVWGVSRMSVWRYRQRLPYFQLPTFKSHLEQLAEQYGIPRKRGPRPKEAPPEKPNSPNSQLTEDAVPPFSEQSPESPPTGLPPDLSKFRRTRRPILNYGTQRPYSRSRC